MAMHGPERQRMASGGWCVRDPWANIRGAIRIVLWGALAMGVTSDAIPSFQASSSAVDRNGGASAVCPDHVIRFRFPSCAGRIE